LAVAGAVVSTPYLYAEEVLADGRGLLVAFADSGAMAEATLRFLRDRAFQLETRRRAYRYATPMFWPNVGMRYLESFHRAASTDGAEPTRLHDRVSSTSSAEPETAGLTRGGR
jgi:hypothetical protein